GASEWPQSPNLKSSTAFAQAAKDVSSYLLSQAGFQLPTENLLNLFDSGKAPSDVDQDISKFLTQRQKQLSEAGAKAKDLIIYYVGHGGFTAGKQEYFLAIRTTRYEREGASSIRMSDLARTLKEDGSDLRRYLILDCCFAGAAISYMQ